MNPLYIDSDSVSISCDKFSLVIRDLKQNKVIETFAPRAIPYDSIIVQRNHGYLSLASINWIMKHSISLTFLDWRGNILGQLLPEEPLSNELRIAQVSAYLDRAKHLEIAKSIVEAKLRRQEDFLQNLSRVYPSMKIPKIVSVDSTSADSIRDSEALYASQYFSEYAKAVRNLGYEFKGRAGSWRSNTRNMHAADLVNGLLNYSFALLQTYVRRAINSIGLDNSIPFLHELRRTGSLTFDIMELWRTNCEYSVLQTLELLPKRERTHKLTNEYNILLKPETIKVLFAQVKDNLSMEEILANTRILARYLRGERDNLSFILKPVFVNPFFESEEVKHTVLTKTASQLKMNKSTLWYQKQRLKETGSLRLYTKSKQYFS